jgi:hypothetical protein
VPNPSPLQVRVLAFVAAAALLAGSLALRPARARAEEPPAPADLHARLRFVEEHLEARRSYASHWYRGWFAFYAGAAATSTGLALTTRGAERVDFAVGAVKSAAGLFSHLVLQPFSGHLGASELADLPPEARLARAEGLLHRNAAEAATRYDWLRHASNVGLNALGGLVVALLGHDLRRAVASSLLGAAVGEAAIFSQPWGATADLAEYRERFGGDASAPDPGASLEIVPAVGGVGLLVRW